MLIVLLKRRCERYAVALQLAPIPSDRARSAARDDADVRAMRGWRRTLFGDDALALKRGELALTAENGRIALVELEPPAAE